MSTLHKPLGCIVAAVISIASLSACSHAAAAPAGDWAVTSVTPSGSTEVTIATPTKVAFTEGAGVIQNSECPIIDFKIADDGPKSKISDLRAAGSTCSNKSTQAEHNAIMDILGSDSLTWSTPDSNSATIKTDSGEIKLHKNV